MKKNLNFSATALGLINSKEELKQVMLAVLTKEHVLITSGPGSAKSMLALRAFEQFDGANVFKIHMNQETTNDVLFGPVDFNKYKKDSEMVRNTDGSILDADFAFLDEMFDASDGTLRTLLGILNERVWSNGKQVVEAKLHTAIATANYTVDNEKTEAVLDRFLFKSKAKETLGTAGNIKMYKSFLAENGSFKLDKKYKIDIKDLKKMSDDVLAVKIDDEYLEVLEILLEEFTKEHGKKFSSRTRNKFLRVMQANAVIANRAKVEVDDVAAVKYAMCTLNDTEETKIFNLAYGKASALLTVKQELKDTAKTAEKIAKKDTSKMQIGDFIKHLKAAKIIKNKLENISDASSLPSSYEKLVSKSIGNIESKINEITTELESAKNSFDSTPEKIEKAEKTEVQF